MSETNVVNIGYNNIVMRDKIVAIVGADAAPMRRLRNEARKLNRLIDATNGRKTRSIIITDSNHVVLSSSLPETITQRIEE